MRTLLSLPHHRDQLGYRDSRIPMWQQKSHIVGCGPSIILKDYDVKLTLVPFCGVEFLGAKFIHIILVTLQIVKVYEPDFADFSALDMTLA